MSYCRAFNKILSEIDNETVEDMFDMLIVACLTDDENANDGKPKTGYIDQTDI